MKADASLIHLDYASEPERIVSASLAAFLYYYIFIYPRSATILGRPGCITTFLFIRAPRRF
jgi:hypothetical protein